MKDSFYTSVDLAEILINYIGKRHINSVADFCVGGGELLRAAESRWNGIQCFGTDISEQAISILRLLHPSWNIEICDFLSEGSRNSLDVLKNKKFDLILLNPPFTCKGSTIHQVIFDNKTFYVSTAMLFLVEALKYMANDGEIFAILPISVAYSQKDRKIREYLIAKYGFSILEERDKQSFKRCSPNIILASLNSKINKGITYSSEHINIEINEISIFRGSISMNEIFKYSINGKHLIHSTNLINNSIVGLVHKIDTNRSEVIGPAVLLHRVGNPSMKKICIIPEGESYLLSDCVVAIKTKTESDSIKLQKLLFENWNNIKNLYKGTGAKYITIDRLERYLGIRSKIQ